MVFSMRFFIPVLLVSLFCGTLPAAATVEAQGGAPDFAQELGALKEALAAQKKLIDAQQTKLAKQEKELTAQRKKLEKVARASEKATAQANAEEQGKKAKTEAGEKTASAQKGKQEKTGDHASTKTAEAAPPKTDVQMARQEQPVAAQATGATNETEQSEQRPEIAALADAGGVLTPKGTLMFEDSIEYTNTSRDIFTFNGVQLTEVVLVGVLNASSARRTVVQNNARLRMGLTDRLEADLRLPLVYRNDATSTTDTTTNTTTRRTIEGSGVGDVDFGASYQLNAGRDGWPFFVANARYKLDTGEGPFEISYDNNNIAERLPTGTGFQTMEGSVTAIKLTDPAVLYANVGYVYSMGEDVNRTFGNTRVLEVSPGDAVNGSLGMGFSINPETSFSMGYKHSHVFPTTQESQVVSTGARVESKTQSQQVGAVTLGLTHRFDPSVSLSFNVEAGVTNDAPDARLSFRVPVRLGDFY